MALSVVPFTPKKGQVYLDHTNGRWFRVGGVDVEGFISLNQLDECKIWTVVPRWAFTEDRFELRPPTAYEKILSEDTIPG